jgi:DNA-binding response OmpR family regulator
MHRILLLDSEHPLRPLLIETLERTANTEVVAAADEEELVSNLRFGTWAAVFVDEELLLQGPTGLIEAMRSSVVRPMLVIASSRKCDDLDPDLVTLVVRKPYDVPTLTGILVAAVVPPMASGGKEDAARVG